MEMYEFLLRFVNPELIVLVVVLYLIGIMLKGTAWFPDKDIPFMLTAMGMFAVLLYGFGTDSPVTVQEYCTLVFNSFIQGVLCAGMSVYINQFIKQTMKKGD